MPPKRTLQPILVANKTLSNFLNAPTPLKETELGIWTLRANFNSFITESGVVIWRFPVKEELEVKAASYPFYFSITILIDPTESIQELNIKIFKEDDRVSSIQADIKQTEVLLRAEWVNCMNDQNAQPHWHIHSYTLIKEFLKYSPEKRQLIKSLLDEDAGSIEKALTDVEELNDTDKSEEMEIPTYKFHLAMVSDWDRELSKTSCKTLDSVNLKTWLPQCLGYMQSQIEYLLRKLPER